MEIAIISDTHLPKGSRRLPEACVARLTTADLIIHGGDLVQLSVLQELQALGPRVVAVHGNVDDAAVRAALPETAIVDAGEHRIGIIHDAGPATGRLRRLHARFPDAQAVVFGHSHIPLHERAPNGFQIFNPGSPTDRRRQPRFTMGACRGHAGARLEFELVELP
ncbi:MAG TPA: metallophosphoesterase family protein [Solirubrobacteraceae bacterium]|nr:metallophosphoesterase family protein [Solirubrobacteraceae bacterium]